jgi:hypothetical protein
VAGSGPGEASARPRWRPSRCSYPTAAAFGSSRSATGGDRE